MALLTKASRRWTIFTKLFLVGFPGHQFFSMYNVIFIHCAETLRKYPSLPFLNRECTKDIDLPGVNIRVETGTPIIIPVLGIHSNSDIYQNPDKFDPERFSEENIARRHQYAYLAFGEGPRNCIGTVSYRSSDRFIIMRICDYIHLLTHLFIHFRFRYEVRFDPDKGRPPQYPFQVPF